MGGVACTVCVFLHSVELPLAGPLPARIQDPGFIYPDFSQHRYFLPVPDTDGCSLQAFVAFFNSKSPVVELNNGVGEGTK